METLQAPHYQRDPPSVHGERDWEGRLGGRAAIVRLGDGYPAQFLEYLHLCGIILTSQAHGSGSEEELMRECRHRQRKSQLVSNIKDNAEILHEDIDWAQRR